MNINYNSVLKEFYIKWEALEHILKEERPNLPTLSKTLLSLHWIESIKYYIYYYFGFRYFLFLFVIQYNVHVPDKVMYPLQDQTLFRSSGSIIDEMIYTLGDDGPFYNSDDASVYSFLEEEIWGIVYVPTVKSCVRWDDEISYWLLIISSHSG